MKSHSDGEVWGLAVCDATTVVTSADDNKLIAWDVSKRSAATVGRISDTDRKPPKGGASTLSDLAPSKCARAVAYNQSNGHLAIGHNDGTLTIKTKDDLTTVITSN